MTRSFNHIGPGQKENFVISAFAKQIAEYKAGVIKNMQVGNLDIVRDFLDVRDVVKAYVALMEKGVRGQAYNICSGHGHSLKEILHMMMSIAGVSFDYHVDQNLIRPSDNPIIIGSNEKIKAEIGWTPSYTMQDSLKSMLTYWEGKVK
jgi:GDP-4-dehydro-6-deoxy-D-mannose reductase